MNGLIGRKLGMTRVFNAEGTHIPVTVIEAGPCAVVAVAERHPLASRRRVTIDDLENQPLIVPERRSRPHSHDLTMKLFAEAGLEARVAQIADEKQTIVNLVSAGLGVAIVPRWTSRMATRGVRFIRLAATDMNKLPLAAAFTRGTRDPVRDDVVGASPLGVMVPDLHGEPALAVDDHPLGRGL